MIAPFVLANKITTRRARTICGASSGLNLIEIAVAIAIAGILGAVGMANYSGFNERSDANTIRTVRAALQSTIAQSIDAFETTTTALPSADVLTALRVNNTLSEGAVITSSGTTVSDGFTMALNTDATRGATLAVSEQGRVTVSDITGFSSVTLDEVNGY